MTKTSGRSLREKLLRKKEHCLPYRDQTNLRNTACCPEHFHNANQSRSLQTKVFKNCCPNAYGEGQNSEPFGAGLRQVQVLLIWVHSALHSIQPLNSQWILWCRDGNSLKGEKLQLPRFLPWSDSEISLYQDFTYSWHQIISGCTHAGWKEDAWSSDILITELFYEQNTVSRI